MLSTKELEKEIEKNQFDSAEQKIDAQNELAWTINRDESKRALSISEETLEQSRGLNYKKGIACALRNIGICKTWHGEYKEGYSFTSRALQLFKDLKDLSNQGQCYYNTAMVAYKINDSETELSYFTKSWKTYKEVGDEKGIANALNGIGSVLYDLGKNEEAIEKLAEALALSTKLQDTESQGRILHGLAESNINLEQYKEAVEFLEKAIACSPSNYTMSNCHWSMGKALEGLSDYEAALVEHEKALSIVRSIGMTDYEVESELAIARCHVKIKADDKTVLLVENILKRVSDSKPSVAFECHRLLEEVYSGSKDVEKQVFHLQKQLHFQNSMHAERLEKNMQGLAIQNELEQEKTEIAEHALEKKESQLQKAYEDSKLISQIGNRITSNLNFDAIAETTYKELQQLLKTECIVFGVYDKDSSSLYFPGNVEKGKKNNPYTAKITEKGKMAVACFVNREEILIGDLRSEAAKYTGQEAQTLDEDTELPDSLIYIPLYSASGEITGVFSVQAFEKNAYTRYHLDLFRSIAVYVAIAVENARLYENLEVRVEERTKEVTKQKEELEKAHRDIELIGEIGQQIIATLSTNEIIKKVYKNVNALMDASAFGIGIYDDKQEGLFFSGFIEKGEILDDHYSYIADNSLAAQCYKSGKLVYLNNNATEAVIGDPTKSIIYYPLIANSKKVGVLTVQSFEAEAYTDRHTNIIETLAVYAAIAIQNAQSLENLKVLSDLGREITSTLELEKVLMTVYEGVNQLMDAPIFAIASYNSKTHEINYDLAIENGDRILQGHVVKMQSERAGYSEWCIFNKSEIIISNSKKEYSKYIDKRRVVKGGDTVSIIYIPLIIEDEVIGILTVQSMEENAYGNEDLEILKSLASYVGVALNNAKSFEDIRLLGDIGKDVTSSLDLDPVLDLVYKNVNELMDAACFAISYYDKERGVVGEKLSIENGERLPQAEVEVTNTNSLNVQCILNKHEIILEELDDLKKYIPDLPVLSGGEDLPQSAVFIPLQMGHEVIGTLNVQSFKKRAYRSKEVNLLRSLSGYVAVALNNAKSFENIKTLGDIGREVTSTLQLESVLHTVYDNVNQLMDAAAFAISYYEEDKGTISEKLAIENGKQLPNYVHKLEDHQSLSGVCVLEKKEIIINKFDDIYDHLDMPHITPGTDDTQSAVFIPLTIENKIVGTLSVQSFREKAYDENQLNLLRSLAGYVAVALNNAQSYETIKILGQIGKDVTSSLNLESVLHKVYDNVNKLMDATIFGIAAYIEEKETIVDKLSIEKGETLGLNEFPLNRKNSLNSYCIINKEEIVVNCHQDNEKYVEDVSITPGTEPPESSLFVPLLIENKVVGTVTVQSFRKNAYSETQIDLLRSIGGYVAVALNNAKAYDNIHELSRIGQQITATFDLESVMETVYQGVNHLMDASSFGVSYYDEENQQIHGKSFIENGVKLDPYTIPIDYPNSLAAWCIKNKREVHINDYLQDFPKYVDDAAVLVGGDSTQSILFVPLIVEKRVIGCITAQSPKKDVYNEYHVEMLRTLGSYVAVALNNAESYNKLEEAHKELEKLSIVASETDNAILITDSNGEMEWVNDAFTEQTGFTLTEVLARYGSNIRDLSTVQDFESYLDEAFSTKRSVVYEHQYQNHEGRDMWVQTTLTPIASESGEITKLVAIDADINDRKKAELKLQEKNKDITDSINYASRIQRAMLPLKDSITSFYPDSFILYRPRDIVSGDFYWTTTTKDNELIVAAVDCTGHGVPGAFLTIVGNNILNQIINFDNITEPGEVLSLMNKGILSRFQTSEDQEIKDGMDISICKIKPTDGGGKVEFAGAYNPLYYVRDNEVLEVKGSRFAIGTPLDDNPEYESHEVEMKKGDMMYLFSDGYADQLGGARGKKFMRRRFKELLLEICQSPANDQENRLSKNLDNWRGNIEQIDDVLVMGIKF